MANLESRLIFGTYPEVVIMQDNARRRKYLCELVNSYLFKDILELGGIRHSKKLMKLLQLMAFQIRKEVSIHELGTQVGMSKNTVLKYFDLLEKGFVISHRTGFRRNSKKSQKLRVIFYGNGIRNAVINYFNLLNMRDDIGAFWENDIVVERLKRNEYLNVRGSYYFWRTYDRKKIDLVEEIEGTLSEYEIKWKTAEKKFQKTGRAHTLMPIFK